MCSYVFIVYDVSNIVNNKVLVALQMLCFTLLSALWWINHASSTIII